MCQQQLSLPAASSSRKTASPTSKFLMMGPRAAPVAAPEIIIRHYQPQDLAQIKTHFSTGMMSNVDAVMRQSLVLQENIWILIFWTIAVAVYTQNMLWPVIVLLLSVLVLYGLLHHGFVRFVHNSIQDDLSNIDKVYIKPGGCFLVAVRADAQSVIVGMVAGEKKGSQQYELRRMCVSKAMRGRGLGKLLIQCLEKEIGSGKMMLSTAILAAQKLYEKNGFKLMGKCRWLAFLVPLEVYMYRYEKDF